MTVQDTGYDPQKAVAAYQQMSGDVIGLGLVLGSSIVKALLPSVQQENMFLNFAGWTSDILPSENVAIAGTTYDIEAINAVDFLMKEKGIKAGDKIGHLYFEGDYGENALKGSKFAADEAQLKIVEQKITPADQDMTGQVAAFKKAGVKAILFSAAPTAGRVAGRRRRLAEARRADRGQRPRLDAAAADQPGRTALKENSTSSPAWRRWRWTSRPPPPCSRRSPRSTRAPSHQDGSLYAYAGRQVANAVLQKACDNKDLTRKGVLDALHQISGLDTGGLVAGTLDFTNPAAAVAHGLHREGRGRVPGAAEGGRRSAGGRRRKGYTSCI